MKKVTIECRSLLKTFETGDEKTVVLKNINFTAHENEINMLMGPSGSGKSTLLSIIAGLIKQDGGDCLVLGTSINDLPEQEKTIFRGKNIGFVFQHINLIPTLSITQNVIIPLLLQGIPFTIALEKAESLLISFGLKRHLNAFPSRLSGGEQQRVSIARACIHNPSIILCDEPTSFLDLDRGQKIMDLLKKIKEDQNATIIIVTHDPRIRSYADSVFILDDGKIERTQ